MLLSARLVFFDGSFNLLVGCQLGDDQQRLLLAQENLAALSGERRQRVLGRKRNVHQLKFPLDGEAHEA